MSASDLRPAIEQAFAAWAEREPGGLTPANLDLSIEPSLPLALS